MLDKQHSAYITSCLIPSNSHAQSTLPSSFPWRDSQYQSPLKQILMPLYQNSINKVWGELSMAACKAKQTGAGPDRHAGCLAASSPCIAM